jgi:hypothetical protein
MTLNARPIAEIDTETSDFDENDFFDTVENDNTSDGHGSTFMDDNWITDSASVADSETRSFRVCAADVVLGRFRTCRPSRIRL